MGTFYNLLPDAMEAAVSGSTYQCAFSVTPAENGYVGAYTVLDEAGDVLETWQGHTAFPTRGLALAGARSRADAAVRALTALTVVPKPG